MTEQNQIRQGWHVHMRNILLLLRLVEDLGHIGAFEIAIYLTDTNRSAIATGKEQLITISYIYK